jgi:hypothetical protein
MRRDLLTDRRASRSIVDDRLEEVLESDDTPV